MSDLAKRLRIKAGMIEMGERIAWGSDSALMREAADALGMAAPAVQGEPVAQSLTPKSAASATIDCWSCSAPVLLDDRADADGNCPYCSVQLDLEEYLRAAIAQPAPDVAGLLNRIVPRIDAGGPNPIDPDIHCCEWTLHRERERIHAEFADALAAHRKQGGDHV